MLIREFILLNSRAFFSDSKKATFLFCFYKHGILIEYRRLGFSYPFKSKQEVFTFMRAYGDLLIEAV